MFIERETSHNFGGYYTPPTTKEIPSLKFFIMAPKPTYLILCLDIYQSSEPTYLDLYLAISSNTIHTAYGNLLKHKQMTDYMSLLYGHHMNITKLF